MSKFQNKYNTETAKEYVRKFNCELLDEYKGMNEKHEFICSCGKHFITTFAKFQNRNKRKCNDCSIKMRASQSKLKYDDVKNRIEKYGCKLISDKYTSRTEKNLKIMCPCGNIFITSLMCFENSKHQCPTCSQMDANEFKNKYTVDNIKCICEENGSELVEYNALRNYIGTKDNVTLKCRKCGKRYSTSLGYILSSKKFTCNDCSYESAPSSSGELYVKEILDGIDGIDYKEQYSFDDCRDKYTLRFDFAVFKNNNIFLIEWDGIQHFKPFEYYGGINKYKDVIKKDSIKNAYCETHNIPLLRIKYNDTNIENKIYNFLAA